MSPSPSWSFLVHCFFYYLYRIFVMSVNMFEKFYILNKFLSSLTLSSTSLFVIFSLSAPFSSSTTFEMLPVVWLSIYVDSIFLTNRVRILRFFFWLNASFVVEILSFVSCLRFILVNWVHITSHLINLPHDRS